MSFPKPTVTSTGNLVKVALRGILNKTVSVIIVLIIVLLVGFASAFVAEPRFRSCLKEEAIEIRECIVLALRKK